MTKRRKILEVGVFMCAIFLMIVGISTPGLLPWQLPACLVGGYFFGRGLSIFAYYF